MKRIKVSIVIPTFQCEKVLKECLRSISTQDFDLNTVEILVVDGMSKDNTRHVAKEYGAILIDNPKVIHPLGRILGIQHSKGELVLCLDSDNILPDPTWLSKMVTPFEDPKIIASEPLYYLSRPADGIVTKYCAALGADDPLIVQFGFHERYSELTRTWTNVPRNEVDRGEYLEVQFLDAKNIPSLGANGFIVRRKLLLEVLSKEFFHVDICHNLIKRNKNVLWAKVKTGVIHIHGDTLSKFLIKKKRRVKRRVEVNSEMGYFYPITPTMYLRLMLKSFLVLPIIWESIRAFYVKKSIVWIYHPIIHYSVLWIYGSSVIVSWVWRKNSSREYEKV